MRQQGGWGCGRLQHEEDQGQRLHGGDEGLDDRPLLQLGDGMGVAPDGEHGTRHRGQPADQAARETHGGVADRPALHVEQGSARPHHRQQRIDHQESAEALAEDVRIDAIERQGGETTPPAPPMR